MAMEEARRPSIIIVQTGDPTIDDHQVSLKKTNLEIFWWWLKISVFTILVLVSQGVATILGRLYFEKGGNSKWLATLVQPVGFPILIPFLFLFPTQKQSLESYSEKKPPFIAVASTYLFLGVLMAGYCMLSIIGIEYMPVSTFSLLSATQLAFNALFSYFLNAQKFTPYIINSLVLLTTSSVLLVFQNGEGDSSSSPNGKYILGFLCTLGSACGYGLSLASTQVAFTKILKSATFKVVFEMNISVSMIASLVIIVGLFSSGEWETLHDEMEGYKLGKVSYVMVLLCTAILWQIFLLGMLGLIYEASSLFSNVISTLGLAIIPIAAVFVFHDKMNGIKAISLVLAVWGFTSYFYEHYLDNSKQEAAFVRDDGINNTVNEEISLTERA